MQNNFIAAVFDTETTDINGEIIQTGFLGLSGNFIYDNPQPLVWGQNYKPEGKITFGAMATHHILPEELEDCPPSSSFSFPKEIIYMIGHNIDYDYEVSGKPEHVKRIDTLAMSRKLYPEDSHTLSAMVYRLQTDKKIAREMVKLAHDAQGDVRMTYWLLCQLIEEANKRLSETSSSFRLTDWESLYQFSEHSRIPDVMPFGKHKGVSIKDVPEDYVNWYRCQESPDPYIIKAFAKVFPLKSV